MKVTSFRGFGSFNEDDADDFCCLVCSSLKSWAEWSTFLPYTGISATRCPAAKNADFWLLQAFAGLSSAPSTAISNIKALREKEIVDESEE